MEEFNLLDKLSGLDGCVDAIDNKIETETGESKRELEKLADLLSEFICKAEAWDIRYETVRSELEGK